MAIASTSPNNGTIPRPGPISCDIKHIIKLCHFTNVEMVNSLSASSDYGCLIIIFAYNLDPDQDRQSVGPDIDDRKNVGLT